MKTYALLVCLFALVVAGVPCFSSDLLPHVVVHKENSIRITVDPRIELISIVQYLSTFRDPAEPLIVREQFQYRADVDAHFRRFADLPAVLTMTRLSESGCSFSWPAISMLYLDQNLHSRRDLIPNEYLPLKCGDSKQLKEFADQLRAFKEQSDFTGFFKRHLTFYAEIERELAGTLDHDYVSELEQFYGIRNARYDLFLVPLYGPVGYGPALVTRTGEQHICAILGTRSVRQDRPTFGDKEYLQFMQRHEFSHSFVNPLTTRFSAEANKSSGLLRFMDVARKRGVCGDWEECLNESVVRAVTTHLAFADSQQAGHQALEKEVSRGAVLTTFILSALQDYSKNRAKHPDFASYYPVLLANLAQEDARRREANAVKK